ncbi:hypothetical protein AHF37_06011 [Paragonimus kellicotti]|nr:hypothetical protein AHF37_06011 [Paragonimus kellicotti]
MNLLGKGVLMASCAVGLLCAMGAAITYQGIIVGKYLPDFRKLYVNVQQHMNLLGKGVLMASCAVGLLCAMGAAITYQGIIVGKYLPDFRKLYVNVRYVRLATSEFKLLYFTE